MKLWQRVTGVVLGLVVLAACGSAAADTGTGTGSTTGVTCTSANGSPIIISGVDDVQLQNSQAVYEVAQGLNLPTQQEKDEAAVVGITVIWTESTAGKGSPYGQFDRGDVMNGVPTTSRGLFQQIAAWGPLEDRLDPKKSASMFYNGGKGGQKGLLSVSGWQTLDVHIAAQAIEQSEFSDGRNYLPNVSRAQSIVQALGGSVKCTANATSGSGAGTVTACAPGTDRAALVATVLGSPNLKLREGREASQTSDIQTGIECPTVAVIASMLTIGVPIRINSLMSDHPVDTGYHPKGMAMDLGYLPGDQDGAKVYEFLYKNAEALGVIQIIWAYPPTIDGIDPSKKCIQQNTNGLAASFGVKGDCDGLYPSDIADHTDHIHMAVHR